MTCSTNTSHLSSLSPKGPPSHTMYSHNTPFSNMGTVKKEIRKHHLRWQQQHIPAMLKDEEANSCVEKQHHTLTQNLFKPC